jgi:hypothetical protein
MEMEVIGHVTQACDVRIRSSNESFMNRALGPRDEARGSVRIETRRVYVFDWGKHAS